MNIPRTRRFWSVSLAHMLNDTFISMGPVVLAFLSVSILPMSNTQIGLTVSATQFIGAVSQPGFGLMADRTGGRWLGSLGAGWTVGFFMIALVTAQTGYFWLMFLPFVLRAVGSGAFHPVGAMHAADSDPDQAASNLSYFFLMGQMGLALGPAIAGILLDVFNASSSTAFMLPLAGAGVEGFVWSARMYPLLLVGLAGLPLVWWMITQIPDRATYQAAQPTTKQARLDWRALPLKAFAVLGALVALRSLAQPGSVAFIPVLFQQKGWTPAEYGAITSLFWVGSGVAGVFFGNLADRIDRRLVVTGSLVVGAPAFFLLPLVDGVPSLVLAVLAGALTGGSHSIIVVLAQELIPAAKGFASGAILGFIFGMGALGSVLIGALSDVIGLGVTFQLVAGALILAGGLALFLPDRTPPTPPPTIEDAIAEAV